MFSGLRRAVILSAIGCYQSTLAASNMDFSEDLFSLSLQELSSIPITGPTLTYNTIFSVPAAVTVFQASDIRRMAVTSVEELMNYVPGFQSYRAGELAPQRSYAARGNAAGSTGREILIIIDGIRTENIWTSGTAFTIPGLPLNAIQRIEFIRGPGSAIYGSNAYTGVINIITNHSDNAIHVKTAQHQNNALAIAAGITGSDWNLHLNARLMQDDGETLRRQDSFSGDTTQLQEQQQAKDINFYARYRNTEFQLLHSERDGNGGYILGRLDQKNNQYSLPYTAIRLQQNLDWNQDFTSKLSAGYRSSEEEIDFAAFNRLIFSTKRKENEQWLKLHNDLNLNASSSLQLGSEYRVSELEIAQAEAIISPTPLVLARPQSQEVYSLYGQYSTTWLQRLAITAGARYDDYPGIDQAFRPRLALVLPVNDHLTGKALYSEAFRAPGFISLYASNNNTVIGNPELKPETVKTWELIALANWRRYTLQLNYFQNHFDNAIYEGHDGNARIYLNANTTTKSKGWELELIAPLSGHWSFRGHYTHLITTPDTSFRLAKDTRSASLNYEPGRWNINLSGYYQGHRDYLNVDSGSQQALKSFWVANLKLGYQALSDIHVAITAQNLFDRHYQTPSQFSTRQPMIDPGRQIGAEIRWEW